MTAGQTNLQPALQACCCAAAALQASCLQAQTQQRNLLLVRARNTGSQDGRLAARRLGFVPNREVGSMANLVFLASIVHSWSIGSAFVPVHTNAFKRSSSVGAYNIGQGDSAEGGDDATSSKSIDDYVLNVHGGKYRFDDPSSIGSAAGQDFAQSLYSSSSTIEADIAAAEEE